jgi:hypothetical protein
LERGKIQWRTKQQTKTARTKQSAPFLHSRPAKPAHLRDFVEIDGKNRPPVRRPAIAPTCE